MRVTIFSTGGKFRPVSIFFVVTRSYSSRLFLNSPNTPGWCSATEHYGNHNPLSILHRNVSVTHLAATQNGLLLLFIVPNMSATSWNTTPRDLLVYGGTSSTHSPSTQTDVGYRDNPETANESIRIEQSCSAIFRFTCATIQSFTLATCIVIGDREDNLAWAHSQCYQLKH